MKTKPSHPGFQQPNINFICWITSHPSNSIICRIKFKFRCSMHGWHCYIFKTYPPDKLSKLRTTGPRSPTLCRRFWCLYPRIFGRRHLPSKRAWKVFTGYTEDVDVVFTKNNSSLLTLERGQWIRMLCDAQMPTNKNL